MQNKKEEDERENRFKLIVACLKCELVVECGMTKKANMLMLSINSLSWFNAYTPFKQYRSIGI